MLITEKNSLQLFGHDIYMAAKPTSNNLETFLDFMSDRNIPTIVPLLPIQDIYLIYGFNLLEVYEDSNLNVIHYPIEDFYTPDDLETFDYFLSEIGDHLRHGNILIHCSAGLGRTGLVTAALLIKYRQYDFKKAIEIVRESRWGAVETSFQKTFLYQYDYYSNGER